MTRILSIWQLTNDAKDVKHKLVVKYGHLEYGPIQYKLIHGDPFGLVLCD